MDVSPETERCLARFQWSVAVFSILSSMIGSAHVDATDVIASIGTLPPKSLLNTDHFSSSSESQILQDDTLPGHEPTYQKIAVNESDIPGTLVVHPQKGIANPPAKPNGCATIRTGRRCDTLKQLPACFSKPFDGSWISLNQGSVEKASMRAKVPDKYQLGKDIPASVYRKLPPKNIFGDLKLPVRTCAIVGSSSSINNFRCEPRFLVTGSTALHRADDNCMLLILG
mmetsp:Transcript_25756/g.48722  ORF Transcript_25756/g.48722 Transcript_25756/m.48722 type:complete len:227 (-) Transcript_25756:117-797(-)